MMEGDTAVVVTPVSLYLVNTTMITRQCPLARRRKREIRGVRRDGRSQIGEVCTAGAPIRGVGTPGTSRRTPLRLRPCKAIDHVDTFTSRAHSSFRVGGRYG